MGVQRCRAASHHSAPYNLSKQIEDEILTFAVARITTLTYAHSAAGLLSGAIRLDRQFASGDMRKTTDPKFQLRILPSTSMRPAGWMHSLAKIMVSGDSPGIRCF